MTSFLLALSSCARSVIRVLCAELDVRVQSGLGVHTMTMVRQGSDRADDSSAQHAAVAEAADNGTHAASAATVPPSAVPFLSPVGLPLDDDKADDQPLLLHSPPKLQPKPAIDSAAREKDESRSRAHPPRSALSQCSGLVVAVLLTFATLLISLNVWLAYLSFRALSSPPAFSCPPFTDRLGLLRAVVWNDTAPNVSSFHPTPPPPPSLADFHAPHPAGSPARFLAAFAQGQWDVNYTRYDVHPDPVLYRTSPWAEAAHALRDEMEIDPATYTIEYCDDEDGDRPEPVVQQPSSSAHSCAAMHWYNGSQACWILSHFTSVSHQPLTQLTHSAASTRLDSSHLAS